MKVLAYDEAFSHDEKDAIEHYSSPRHYSSLNKAAYTESKMTPFQHHLVKHLDSATKKNRLKEDTHLYRGISGVHPSSFEPGKVYHHKSYMSTTTNPSTARDFTSGGKHPTVLKIHAPKGTPHLHVPSAQLSGALKEDEHLLPRGTRYRVTHVKPASGKRGVHVVHAVLEDTKTPELSAPTKAPKATVSNGTSKFNRREPIKKREVVHKTPTHIMEKLSNADAEAKTGLSSTAHNPIYRITNRKTKKVVHVQHEGEGAHTINNLGQRIPADKDEHALVKTLGTTPLQDYSMGHGNKKKALDYYKSRATEAKIVQSAPEDIQHSYIASKNSDIGLKMLAKNTKHDAVLDKLYKNPTTRAAVTARGKKRHLDAAVHDKDTAVASMAATYGKLAHHEVLKDHPDDKVRKIVALDTPHTHIMEHLSKDKNPAVARIASRRLGDAREEEKYNDRTL